jgi:peptidoglycan-associated lipoprotein
MRMRRQFGRVAGLALVVAATGACATKGFVREQVAAERTARAQADSSMQTELSMVRNDVGTLRGDVEALRGELQALRTEFGARISALDSGLQFAFPVNFAFDDASVRPQDQEALDRFASVVGKYYGTSLLTVEGFADPAGAASYNRRLSQRRAEAVRAYLVNRGLMAEQIRAIGYGESRLVNPGAWGEDSGAEQNRRVVFVVETRGERPSVAQLGLEPQG